MKPLLRGFLCVNGEFIVTTGLSTIFFWGFSVLAADAPWDHGSLWSTMAFYMFNLHIPLSFGGNVVCGCTCIA
ncbi:uncharacterized protein Pyn_11615 [Prunus yedoensis var. nudiflora]|uniref:Uncharacterized protein n=1 Tax=Prunus yedoensis var. nudiflora TaxID=2094558 RepID=A0A314UFV0_PRUYE|nr:uncharacterized protein Pyn_11615 [Prunus yedoensis var. nudiflora]